MNELVSEKCQRLDEKVNRECIVLKLDKRKIQGNTVMRVREKIIY